MDKTSTAGGQARAKRVFDVAKSTVQRFMDGGGTDRAAAMAYYAIQALFPAILVLVLLSLLLSSSEAITDAVDWAVDRGLDADAAAALNRTLQDAVTRASGGAGFAALILALTSVYSASGWLAAAGRAIEPDPARRRERNFVLGKVRFSLWTLLLLGVATTALVLLSLGGGLADDAFQAVGWEAGAPGFWTVLRPGLVMAGIIGAMLVLYRVAPDRIEPRPLRRLLPGALLAGFGVVLASVGFGFWVQNLATVGATYGAFATPIVLLLWLWLTGVVVLFGASLNSELAERRGDDHVQLRLAGADDPAIAGHPAGALPDASDDAVLQPSAK
ncbi:MAG: YihY/virulence factor BrkB family protein [Solirubrobacteraceae bacterium]|nr:YihY/virulence factor BrkB family protein [Solirubrobacteraceae bacterium]